LGSSGEFAVEFGDQGEPRGDGEFGAGGGKRGVLRHRRAIDGEAGPRSDSKAALSDGLLTQSWAQPSRARSSMPPIISGLSKRTPSLLRTSVAFIAA